MPEYIYHLVTAVTDPAPTDDPADFPAQYAADKERIKNSFPNVDGPVTTTDTELQLLSGLTATATELNQLDGVVPVITTTTQTIGGDKTFSDNPTVSNTSPSLRLEETDGAADETLALLTWSGNSFRVNPRNDDLSTKGNIFVVGESSFTYDGNNIFHAGNLLNDDTLSADSNVLPASQSSIKTYVDTAIAAVGGGVVQQIKVATSSPATNPDHVAFQTVEDVTLTGVVSGSDVIVFGLGIYTLSGTTISQRVTDSSNNSISIGDSVATTTGESMLSIGYDASPVVGTNTYRLRCKESASGSSTIANAIMVAVEYTP